jgi:hypothetical protein
VRKSTLGRGTRDDRRDAKSNGLIFASWRTKFCRVPSVGKVILRLHRILKTRLSNGFTIERLALDQYINAAQKNLDKLYEQSVSGEYFFILAVQRILSAGSLGKVYFVFEVYGLLEEFR